MGNSILLSGATGFIGGEILKRLLRAGHRVVAVVRGPAPAARVLERLGRGPDPLRSLPPILEVVEGDITRPGFGWSTTTRLALGVVHEVVHAAGVTAFDAASASRVFAANHAGSVHAARLARDLQARRLTLVSTAFLGGRRVETVPEGPLPERDRFLNPYEESRARGEWECARILAATRTNLLVVRPPIVINDSHTGFAQTREHLYAIWRPLRRLRGDAPSLHLDARVRARPDGTKSMLPVDAVADAIAGLIDHPDIDGYVHVVPSVPLRHTDLLEDTQAVLGIRGLRLADEAEWERHPPSRVELVIDRALASYGDYLRRPEPRIDGERLHRILPAWSEGAPIDRNFLSRAFAAFETLPAARPSPAPAVLGLAEYRRLHLEPRAGRRLVPGIGDLDAAFTVVLAGRPESLGVTIAAGALRSAEPVPRGPVTFMLDGSTFAAIAAGELPPVEAFLSGRIDIQGEVEAGLRLVGILSDFFSRHPYRPSPAIAS